MSPDREFLEDIVVAARLAYSYAATITRDELSQNIEKQDSIVRRLAVIGEASTKVPDHVKADLPEIPWSSIIGLRNILIHQYWELDLDELWIIVQRDLPDLIGAIERYRSLH
ncbi:MAG: DUF86 domain-containing protein [Acidobacteriota bacterium]|nr:DUF86 domain-containing protein [Acidobacteriota bacterium]